MRLLFSTMLLLAFFWGSLKAGQPDTLLPAGEPDTLSCGQIFWGKVDSIFEASFSDTTLTFLQDMAQRHCPGDAQCLYDTYFGFMYRLERRFELGWAIVVAEEMARVARKAENSGNEARAFRHLSRYHAALGNERLAMLNLDRAEELFEQAGDFGAVTRARFIRLENSLGYRDLEEVLPEMDALLRESWERGDTTTGEYLTYRMVNLKMLAGRYEEMERHIEVLEQLRESRPPGRVDYGSLITTNKGRGNLAGAREKPGEARAYYLQALQYAREGPDYWNEVRILQLLAELAWEQQKASEALYYLRQAEERAGELEQHDLQMTTYRMLAEIAEEQRRYADALAYTREEHYHEAQLDARSGDFDVENYFLRLEKGQLEAEKENRELELQLKKTEARNALLLAGGALLLVLLLVALFVYQRRQRKKLALQYDLIKQQAAMLKELDAAKSRFFANVSHELRTPLTLLVGPIQSILKGGGLDKKQQSLLEMVARNGKQLEQLIGQILDLGKLDLDRMEVEKELTPLYAFFDDLLLPFESMALRKDIDYGYELKMPAETWAEIDRTKLRQILNNLLSNAFKFTPPGGQVRVELGIEEEELQMEVRDTGPGIPPEDQPHVFDRYFQTSRSDKPVEGGAGIGLALCQEYIQLLDGQIELESEAGQGTVFRISLPLSGLEQRKAAASAENGHEPADLATPVLKPKAGGSTAVTGRPTLLIVEDNAELQAYLQVILSENYHVLTADNGREALQQLREQPACRLVISDLMMPVMDGYQLLAELKSREATHRLPVIMLTARADNRDRLKALRFGVDDYILKPFDEEELLLRIQTLLQNQEERRQAEQPPGETPPETAPESSAEEEWLEDFEAYVEEHLSDDTLSVPALAEAFNMSESTLLRQLKKLTGLTPARYLKDMRLEQARRLLENRACQTVGEVADRVGYGNPRSFSRSFRSKYGKLPSDYF